MTDQAQDNPEEPTTRYWMGPGNLLGKGVGVETIPDGYTELTSAQFEEALFQNKSDATERDLERADTVQNRATENVATVEKALTEAGVSADAVALLSGLFRLIDVKVD